MDDHSVAGVDLARYSGLWYEIASLPARFQEGCVCSTAEYRVIGDYVEVTNSCRQESPQGKLRRVTGKARPVPGSNNSRLKVTFFWPFSGDYWIVGLDPDYRWAMVGHPQRKYLWILSRQPELDEKTFVALLERARVLGYPVERLRRSDQSCD